MTATPPKLRPIVTPARVWARSEVLSRPSPVPPASGVYAWYFRDLPGPIDASECVEWGGLRLLYVGISPRRPAAGTTASAQDLRKRLRMHFRGPCDGSTLRMSLGCLLATPLGIRLGRRPRSGRYTFGAGEAILSSWMEENAFVTWLVAPEPWEIEELAIHHLDLPLNLQQNGHHAFHRVLTEIRRAARLAAREQPCT